MYLQQQPESNAARRLIDLVSDLPLEGIERSVKLGPGTVSANRFLLGIAPANLPTDRLLSICRQLAMPGPFLADLTGHLPQANLILFGFEQDDCDSLYKVYLEFWDRLTTQVRANPSLRSPVPLHLGYKWDSRDPNRSALTEYTCHPLLTVRDIFKRIKALYAERSEEPSCQTALQLIQRAATRLTNDSFVYLETREPGTPRRGFDINLYKANLTLAEFAPHLTGLTACYGLSANQWTDIFSTIQSHPLGHLSGGLNRRGDEFFTFYYPVDAL